MRCHCQKSERCGGREGYGSATKMERYAIDRVFRIDRGKIARERRVGRTSTRKRDGRYSNPDSKGKRERTHYVRRRDGQKSERRNQGCETRELRPWPLNAGLPYCKKRDSFGSFLENFTIPVDAAAAMIALDFFLRG